MRSQLTETCRTCGRPKQAERLPKIPTANEQRLAYLCHQVRKDAAKLRLARAHLRTAKVTVDTERAEIELSAASLNASHFGIKDADDCPQAILPVPSNNGKVDLHKSVFGE